MLASRARSAATLPEGEEREEGEQEEKAEEEAEEGEGVDVGCGWERGLDGDRGGSAISPRHGAIRKIRLGQQSKQRTSPPAQAPPHFMHRSRLPSW